MEFKFTFAESILQLCTHETSYFFVGKLKLIPVLVRLTIDTTSHFFPKNTRSTLNQVNLMIRSIDKIDDVKMEFSTQITFRLVIS